MEHQAPAIFATIEHSAFSAAIRQSIWLYPVANVGHIVALVVFAGAIAMMEARLLGAFPATAPGPLMKGARHVAIAALCALAATGLLLFCAEAGHLVVNPVFRLKMVLVGVGLLNVLVYELAARRVVEALPAGARMPKSARTAGLLSSAVWIAVAACGRAIAYF